MEELIALTSTLGKAQFQSGFNTRFESKKQERKHSSKNLILNFFFLTNL
jgi:hypothetical protein